MTKTALILGATGRFGRHMTQALQATGWHTPAFDRTSHDLSHAAKTVEVIVYGWNPPYNKWEGQCLKQLQQVIAAARINNATILFPGNVYPFGTEMPEVLSESTPHSAANSLGVLRASMEGMLEKSGVRTIILRAGDFIDTDASGNWFDSIILKNTAKTGKISYPGNPDIAHAWAYLPDLCRAAVMLAEMRDQLPVFADIPYPGYTVSGNEIAATLQEITRGPVKVKNMAWAPLYLARPFWRMAKYLLEMKYLWNTPHRLDSTVFNDLLPGFQTTPLQQALMAAIPAGLVHLKVNPDQPVTAGG